MKTPPGPKHIKELKWFAFAGIACSLVVGCATPRQQGVIVTVPRKPVETIALIRPANPTEIPVLDDSAFNRMASSGGIGALPLLIAGSMTKHGSAKAINAADFAAGNKLADLIVSFATRRGLKVKILDRPSSVAGGFLATYKDLNAGTDAYLDVILDFFGFHDRAFEKGYVPELDASLRLISRHDNSILASGKIRIRPKKRGEPLVADPDYVFETPEQIELERERALKGLEICLDELADAVISEITEKSATIYLYRTRGPLSNSQPPTVMVKNREVAASASPKITTLRVAAGTYFVGARAATFQSKPLELAVVEGYEYWLQISEPFGLSVSVEPKLDKQIKQARSRMARSGHSNP